MDYELHYIIFYFLDTDLELAFTMKILYIYTNDIAFQWSTATHNLIIFLNLICKRNYFYLFLYAIEIYFYIQNELLFSY